MNKTTRTTPKRRILSWVLVACLVLGMMPITMATAAEFTASLPARFVEVGATAQIQVTGTGTFTYTSKDEGLATVDADGLVTGVAMGRVDIDVSDGSTTHTVSVPVVGSNLLTTDKAGTPIRNGVFEEGANIPTIADDTAKFWRVNKGATGLYSRVRPEFVTMDTYLHTNSNVLKMSLLEEDAAAGTGTSRMLLETNESNAYGGHVAVDPTKMYEYTGWMKTENVPAANAFGSAVEIYYYNSRTAVGSALVGAQQTNSTISPFTGTHGSQDWTFFQTPASAALDSAVLGANPRLQHTTNGAIGDEYIGDLSFHEVVYQEMAFAPTVAVNELAIAVDVTTTVNHLTNTGTVIKPARTTSGAIVAIPVTYSTSDPAVATVNSAGVITTVAEGTATITAESTIAGVTRTGSFDVTISASGTVPAVPMTLNFMKAKNPDATGNNGYVISDITDYKYTTAADPEEIFPTNGQATHPWIYAGGGAATDSSRVMYVSDTYGLMLDSLPTTNVFNGAWQSFKFNVAGPGTYTFTSQHFEWVTGAKVRVYVAPADAANPRDLKYSIGSYSTYGPSSVLMRTKLIGAAALRSGEYILTYEIIGKQSDTLGGYRYGFSAMKLNPIETTPSYSVAALSDQTFDRGTSVSVPLVGTATIGASSLAYDLADATISAIAANGTLVAATVERGTGNDAPVIKLRGVRPGTTNVTVTATKPGAETPFFSQTISATVNDVAYVPASISAKPVNGIVEIGTPGKLLLSDENGDAVTADSLSATSSDENIATVAVSGSDIIVTGVALGVADITVTGTFVGGATREATVSVPITGENLLIRSDVNHGAFEAGINALGVSMWTANLTAGFEVLSDSPLSRDGSKILKTSFDGVTKLRSQTQIVANATYPVQAFVSVNPNKLYEFSGYVKLEGVEAGKNPEMAAEIYFYNSNNNPTGTLVANQQINSLANVLHGTSGTTDWTFFQTPASATLDSAVVAANPRFKSKVGAAGNITGNVYQANESFHEVVYNRLDLSASTTTLAPAETVALSATHYSNTGSRILPGKTAAGAAVPIDVTYTSSRPSIATVSTDGVVTAVGGGTAIITATATIAGVTKSATINVTVSGNAAIPVNTTDGAQIRTLGAQGLRFMSRIEKGALVGLNVIEYGTILIPTADITDPADFIIGATLNGHAVAKVPALKLYAETDEYLEFTAVIINIAEHNYTRQYSARAYVIYQDGAEQKILYADQLASRNVYNVAKAAVDDPDSGLDENARGRLRLIVDAVEGRDIELTFTAPAEGGSVPTTITPPAGAGYTVDVAWTTTGGREAGATFESGTDYTLTLTITKNSGAFGSGVAVKLNGETLSAVRSSGDSVLTVTKTYEFRDSGYTPIY